MRHSNFEHRFVEYLPEQMEEGVLYISMKYATAAHCCACGCGEEVITPFTPTDWSMTFNGKTISLSPSIGNWNFPCHSHYFIQHGRAIEATSWTNEQIKAGRCRDKIAKARYYRVEDPNTATWPITKSPDQVDPKPNSSIIRRLMNAIMAFWRKIRYFSKD